MSAAAKTPDTFSAWAASLPESEQYWVCVPRGVLVTYWMVAICKYLLQQKMSAGERLRTSEMLDHQSAVIDAEAIAAIQPAGPAELEIFSATAKASPVTDDKDKSANRAFDLLGSARVFDLLTAANPSVLDAIKSRIARQKAGARTGIAAYAKESTPQPESGGPERYHINSVPTQTVGPASTYDAPARFWPGEERSEQQRFAEGTPNNNPIDPFTGRSRR
jgi:hypothetical protein